MKPIIIVGYGPVGGILALLLARNGIPVIILEAASSFSEEPRAVGIFGPSHFTFVDAGIYDEAKKQGMHSSGLAFRKRSVDDGKGGQRLGEIIASAVGPPPVNGEYPVGTTFILIPQHEIVKIITRAMKEYEDSGMVKVFLGTKFVSSQDTVDGVTVTAVDQEKNEQSLEGSYVVGADGSKSSVRRQLGLHLHGNTWPERLIATDVRRTVSEIPEVPATLVVDQEYWGVITPLEPVKIGKPCLWRYSMAVSDASIPDERLKDPAFVESLLRKHLDGPSDQEFEIVRFGPYKMHQLLATTMRRGRTFLAGDAAHINNPIGGLGLNTGILDADALAQAFVQVLKEGRSESLFDKYSYDRRRVFQMFIDPISKANKQRLHDSAPEFAAHEDWFFASMNHDSPEEQAAGMQPLMTNWRTDMKKFKLQ